jgi:hypothetical protein
MEGAEDTSLLTKAAASVLFERAVANNRTDDDVLIMGLDRLLPVFIDVMAY